MDRIHFHLWSSPTEQFYFTTNTQGMLKSRYLAFIMIVFTAGSDIVYHLVV